jgi:hypothetical protein
MIVAGVLLLGIAVLLFSQLANEQAAAPAAPAAKGTSEAMATGRGPRSPVVVGLKVFQHLKNPTFLPYYIL